MHLAFEFDDFFRHKSKKGFEGCDVKTPTFLLQSGVVGDLMVKDLPQPLLEDEATKLEIKLEGFMRTELETGISNRSQFRLTVDKKILSMTQAMSMRRYTSSSRNNKYYTFNFDVESWMQLDERTSVQRQSMATRSNFAALPPSLKHEVLKVPQGTAKPRAGACVNYQLTASVYRNNKMLRQTFQPILLLHSSGHQAPPMRMADFKGEYRPTQQAWLRGPLYQKMGEVSVTAQEPKQLSISATCTESLVELPLRLCMSRNLQQDSDMTDLFVEAEVTWQFRFSTFVSLAERRGPATMNEAHKSPATAYVRSALDSRSLKMSWRNWRSCEDAEEQKESEQSLWLRLPRAELLTPTFWSPFISRRYSIWLQIKLTKPGSAKLEVEVPIQVAIDANSSAEYTAGMRLMRQSNGTCVFEGTDGDELLPQYVR